MPSEPFAIGQRCCIDAGPLQGCTGVIAAILADNCLRLDLDQAKGVSVVIAAGMVRLIEQDRDDAQQ